MTTPASAPAGFGRVEAHQLAVNSNFSQYDWRLRSGDGGGSQGDPGKPEGWSQDAPQYDEVKSPPATDPYGDPLGVQGVQFNVNTTGYSNVSMHFDWLQGGISDMQPQYSPDGGATWINAPFSGPNGTGLIEATGNDYYGLPAPPGPPPASPSASRGSPPPTTTPTSNSGW